MKAVRLIPLLLVSFFLVTGCEITVNSFLAWDQDGDELVDRREVAAGVLETLDVNESGNLQAREIHAGLEEIGFFELWDEDQDGVVSKLELQFLIPDTGAMVGDPARDIIVEWDEDGNERLEYWEVSTGLHSRWDFDSDEDLSLEEVDSAVHDLGVVAGADTNADGKISYLEATSLVARREILD